MALEVSFTDARDALTKYIARTIGNNKVIKIHYKINDLDHTVAFIAEDELESLIKTIRLLGSPRNAERLYTAFERTESQVLQFTLFELLNSCPIQGQCSP